MHPLDNPIWEALNSSQVRFAESAGAARRFLPEVSLLAGLPEPSQQGFDSLATLVRAEDSVGLFFGARAKPVAGWTIIHEAPLLQMVQGDGAIPFRARDFVELGKADVAEMIALAELTKPGPFSARTRELGTYIGIRENGKLIAMAGERLRVPGYTEISAVCTHPEHLGRGHARALMATLAELIRRRGEVAFLHVRQSNARAVELYERIGFTNRILLYYTLFSRD